MNAVEATAVGTIASNTIADGSSDGSYRESIDKRCGFLPGSNSADSALNFYKKIEIISDDFGRRGAQERKFLCFIVFHVTFIIHVLDKNVF